MKNYENIIRNLENRGFSVNIVNNQEEAIKLLLQLLPQGFTIGVPGSVTIRQLGLIEKLTMLGYKVIDTWDNGDRVNRLEQLNADVVLTSSNAITEDGLLVNLDGTGNRVASLCFGPKKVIAVVGINKITKNLEEAIYRTKNIAAPLIYQRKSSGTPCEKTGYCHDCKTIKTKQCRVLVIHEGKPRGIEEFHIILVSENMGF